MTTHRTHRSHDGVRTRTITWTDPAQSRFRGRSLDRLRTPRRDPTRRARTAAGRGAARHAARRGRAGPHRVQHARRRGAREPDGHDARRHRRHARRHRDGLRGRRRRCPADAGFTTLELKTNYVRAITQATGRVYAEGTVVHSGGRVATTEARVHDDERHAVRARDVDVLDPARCEMTDDTTADHARRRTRAHGARDHDSATSSGSARMFTPSLARQRLPPVLLPGPAAAPRAPCCWLTSVDHGRRDALVALDGDEIVAVARYDGTRRTANTAEIAVTVEDAWQHQGVGRRLTRRLARARDRPRHRVVRRDGATRQPRRARPRCASSRPTRPCDSTAASTRRRCRSQLRRPARAADAGSVA